jgi:nicotinamidase-related amidase
MPTNCLIVVDVQASFTRRPYFSLDGLDGFLAAQNVMIAQARARKVPIVRVFHHQPEGDSSDPFAIASGLVRPLEGLSAFDPALTVYKTRHSALVGTGLDVWLVERGIQRLVISGIRTEQCCETTARHASDLGWTVAFVPAATMTWDIALPDGGTLRAAEIRERTTAVLRGRFAEVLAPAEAFGPALEPAHATA